MEGFEALPHGPNLAARFRKNFAVIPYGTYRIRAHVSGFWSTERDVIVSGKETLVILAFQVGMARNEGGLPTTELLGQLENFRGSDATRVRLSGVYSTVVMDAAVDKAGLFDLKEVPYGSYVLVISQNRKSITARTINLPMENKGPMVLDVGKGP